MELRAARKRPHLREESFIARDSVEVQWRIRFPDRRYRYQEKLYRGNRYVTDQGGFSSDRALNFEGTTFDWVFDSNHCLGQILSRLRGSAM